MIEAIKLNNFQSHKVSELSFHPGVNVITGRSDSGKTAIFRALRWLVFNSPRGKGFIRHGAEECAVTLWVGNEWVERGYISGKNLYQWSLDLTAFTAFGSGVPEEIEKFLNITEINLQSQLDAPFLLSESASGVARHFNDVANLDVIDTATSNVNKWEVRVRRTVADLEEKENTLKTKLKTYEGLDALEKELDAAEALDNRIKALYRDIADLERVKDSLAKVQEQMASLEPYVRLADDVDACISLQDRIDGKRKDINDILLLIDGVCETQDRIAYLQKFTALSGEIMRLEGKETVLKQLKNSIANLGVDVHSLNRVRGRLGLVEGYMELAPEVESLLVVKKKVDSLYDNASRLRRDIDTVERTQLAVERAGRDLEALEADFRSHFPDDGTCPLCGKEMG